MGVYAQMSARMCVNNTAVPFASHLALQQYDVDIFWLFPILSLLSSLFIFVDLILFICCSRECRKKLLTRFIYVNANVYSFLLFSFHVAALPPTMYIARATTPTTMTIIQVKMCLLANTSILFKCRHFLLA